MGLRVEALDVAVAQLELALQGALEAAEVGRRQRLLPGLEPERLRARDLRRQVLGHADGLLEVAPRPVDEPRLVRVGVLPRRPRLERVEQAAELRVGLARVENALERRGHLGPRSGAARRHHRVLVPEHQRAERLEVVHLRLALAQVDELLGFSRHCSTFA